MKLCWKSFSDRKCNVCFCKCMSFCAFQFFSSSLMLQIRMWNSLTICQIRRITIRMIDDLSQIYERFWILLINWFECSFFFFRRSSFEILVRRSLHTAAAHCKFRMFHSWRVLFLSRIFSDSSFQTAKTLSSRRFVQRHRSNHWLMIFSMWTTNHFMTKTCCRWSWHSKIRYAISRSLILSMHLFFLSFSMFEKSFRCFRWCESR